MRDSLQDIAHMVRVKPYHAALPKELEPYHAWISDSGHSIMCVLSVHMNEARTESISDYEVPVPVKYVLENGYKVHEDCIEVEAPYSSTFGLVVDDSYTEW